MEVMIKLFITLNVLLFAAVFLYLTSSNSIGEVLFSQPRDALYDNSGKGTFHLLNKSVRGLSPEQREVKLAELKKQFPYSLDLKKLDPKDFSEKQLKRLQNGFIQVKEIDEADHLYGLLPQTDLLWDMSIDLNHEQDMRNSWAGTFYLIEQALLEHQESLRPQAMHKLKERFGLEVALLPMADLSLSEKQMSQLKNGVIVIDNLGDEDRETFYKKMSDSDSVIFIGSLPYPWIKNFISPLMLSLLVLVVALTTFFWVWTLWKDITRIRKAAERFGEGDLNVRVPYKKTARLAQLSQAFNNMAEQTQRSIRSHKELTSAVSHELRTPVARMRFSLDMLDESHSAKDRSRYVENMNLDMDELDLLLNELLSYARLDQGDSSLKLQALSLSKWMGSAVDSLRGLTGDITLEWEGNGLAKSELADFDPVLMSRLLSNLVQNAARYANTRVLITLSETELEHQICVDDDGSGIPEIDRERLFEAFATRDNSRSKQSEGFGLGLAIVKRIADAHQGTATIHDSPLGGAQFCVRWPKKRTTEMEKAA
jgi:signal transduction histidine kinase